MVESSNATGSASSTASSCVSLFEGPSCTGVSFAMIADQACVGLGATGGNGGNVFGEAAAVGDGMATCAAMNDGGALALCESPESACADPTETCVSPAVSGTWKNSET